ncbi:MAG: PLP-dependent aspartate aminotransferase family protein [Lachnospiraceae bacterium]|nr:PLP-dependent aspartate aminotransferase family protein [Lachnospiraceae bacterium]
MNIDTVCQTKDKNIADEWGALSVPIYQTATFAHKGLGESTGFDYTRMQNPTRQQLEYVVNKLEHGTETMAFASGMASITAVMELFSTGDHIIMDSDLYGGSVRLFSMIGKSREIDFCSGELYKGDYESLFTERTKAVYLETPTNPMMNVTDIEKLAKETKKRGVLLIVDNTFLSPYNQNPLDLGADIVIHSGTKFLGGHHDTIGGFVVVKDETLAEKLRYIYKTTGAGLSPFDSWLILRGIRTLSIRMERAQRNALEIARFLQTNKHVKRVIYPGLKEHPGHEIMKRQSRGFGAIITFEVDSKERVEKILKGTELVYFAESLGGTETLITYPITQTHADVPAEVLKRNNINDRVLRLSVGIEDSKDLINDLKNVLDCVL